MRPNTSTKSVWDREWNNCKEIDNIYPNQQVIDHILYLFSGKINNINILEVGAGSGSDSAFLSKLGAKVTILDFSPQSIKIAKTIAKKENVELKTILSDCKKIPLRSNSYDLVFSVGLVEHFKNPAPVIKEQIRLIKNKGFLLIDIPQKYNLYTIVKKIRMLTGTFHFGWETEYSKPQLKKLFHPYPQMKLVTIYGRDSAIYQKLSNSPIKHILRFFVRNIEKTQLAPYLCLNIGAIYQKSRPTKLKSNHNFNNNSFAG